jgi:uncharacterized membrane protein YbhN (UPF0104 family)
MKNSLVYWIIYFIVTLLVVWVIVTLLLSWAGVDSVFNADGTINWLTTLWVVLVAIILAWLVFAIIWWLVEAMMNSSCCPKPKPKCENPCDHCTYAMTSL